ncbi:MAG: hypothetical protein PHU95_05590 [Candidatus Thermoplasmatota archaeon]|nr:hypothetical protein [Candidatus Thermoplasmatota archaeon]
MDTKTKKGKRKGARSEHRDVGIYEDEDHYPSQDDLDQDARW